MICTGNRQNNQQQVVSREGVTDRGEVFTARREVNAMLDLVKQETENIDSRFLEPACGTGNFLTEVLERKLSIVESRYRRSQLEYEHYAVTAISSIYGIDIFEENVKECRKRLFGIFDWRYSERFKKTAKNDFRNAVQYILNRNIIHGDALTLKTAGDNPKPIVFSEWSFPFNNSKIKRRDFAFHELFPAGKSKEPTLFSKPNQPQSSDLGKDVFIPEPVKEYPLVHFLRIADAQQ